jgi:hypothetical protein
MLILMPLPKLDIKIEKIRVLGKPPICLKVPTALLGVN